MLGTDIKREFFFSIIQASFFFLLMQRQNLNLILAGGYPHYISDVLEM